MRHDREDGERRHIERDNTRKATAVRTEVDAAENRQHGTAPPDDMRRVPGDLQVASSQQRAIVRLPKAVRKQERDREPEQVRRYWVAG